MQSDIRAILSAELSVAIVLTCFHGNDADLQGKQQFFRRIGSGTNWYQIFPHFVSLLKKLYHLHCKYHLNILGTMSSVKCSHGIIFHNL